MVTLAGKEYGLFYSVGAKCAFDNWMVKNGKTKSVAESIVALAINMNEAYNKANGGGEKLTSEFLFSLPAKEYDALAEAVDAQVLKDTEVSVEAEDIKPKKGKSPEKSS